MKHPYVKREFIFSQIVSEMSDTTSNPEGLSTTACAACKFQRKKCTDKCVLAPYFPRDDPDKFHLVHRVFGNGNIIKLLQDLPVEERGEAVNSMVYEASERVRDPVHGCSGVINELYRNLAEMESQLASAKAAVANMSVQHAHILMLITGCQDPLDPNFHSASIQESEYAYTSPPGLDDVDLLQLWDPFCI